MAVNDRRLLPALLYEPKAEYFFTQERYLEYKATSRIDPADFAFRFILLGLGGIGIRRRRPKNYTIVQTAKEIPEELLRYWLRW